MLKDCRVRPFVPDKLRRSPPLLFFVLLCREYMPLRLLYIKYFKEKKDWILTDLGGLCFMKIPNNDNINLQNK